MFLMCASLGMTHAPNKIGDGQLILCSLFMSIYHKAKKNYNLFILEITIP